MTAQQALQASVAGRMSADIGSSYGPELQGFLDQQKAMVGAAQKAYGLNGNDIAPRIDSNALTGSSDDQQQSMLEHVHESIQALSGQIPDDQAAQQTFGSGIGAADVQSGLGSPAIQGQAYLRFGNKAANVLSGMNLASPSASGGVGTALPVAGGPSGGIPTAGGALAGASTSGGGSIPPTGTFPTAAGGATPPPGGRSGSSSFRSNNPFDEQKLVGQFAGLGKALEDLERVTGKASDSTRQLTHAEAEQVESKTKLYRDITSGMSGLVAGAALNPGGKEAQFLQSMESEHGGLTNLARMGQQLSDTSGGMSLVSRARAAETSGQYFDEGGLNDKLMPFFMGGTRGRQARNDMRDTGAYGESGASQFAWQAAGFAAAVPHALVHSRYELRGIESEFLDPMEKARQKYITQQQGLYQDQMQFSMFGGMAAAGGDAYRAAFNPSILAANREQAFGRASQQALGGYAALFDSALGGQNAANMHVASNMIMSGGEAGFLLGNAIPGVGGAVGALAGAVVGGAGWLGGQIATASTDQDTRARVLSAYSRGGMGQALREDFGATVGYSFANLGGQLFDSENWNKESSKESSTVATAQALLRDPGMYTGKANLNMLNATLGPQLWRQVAKDSFTNPYSALYGRDQGLDKATAEKLSARSLAIVGQERFTAADGSGKLAFQSAYDLLAKSAQSGVDLMPLAGQAAELQGYMGGDLESAGFMGALKDVGGFVNKQDSTRRSLALSATLSGQQGMYNAQLMSGQKSTVDWIGAATSFMGAQGNPAALRGFYQGNQLQTSWGQYAGSSSLFSDAGKGVSGGLFDYLQGGLGAADANKWLAVSGNLPTYGSMVNQLEATGVSSSAANLAVTGMARGSAVGVSGGSQRAAQNYMIRNGFGATSEEYEMYGSQYAGMYEAGIDPQAMTGALAAGMNVRPGTAAYSQAVAGQSRAWNTRTSMADYLNQQTAAGPWAQYNSIMGNAGFGRAEQGVFDNLNPDQRGGRVGAAQIAAGVRMGTGFDITSSAAYQSIVSNYGLNTDAGLYQGNVTSGRVAQMGQLFQRASAYGGGTQGNLSALLGVAGGDMSQTDFNQFAAMASGDTLASSLYADTHAGMNQYRFVQTGSQGGTRGAQRGYDETLSAADISDIRGANRRMGGRYLRGVTPDASGTSAGAASLIGRMGVGDSQLFNNQIGREAFTHGLQLDVQQYDIALGNKQLARSQASVMGKGLGQFVSGYEGRGEWYFEDQQRNVGRAQQDYQYDVQGQQLGLRRQGMDLGNQQFSENWDFNKKRFEANTAYQSQSMSVQRSHQQTEFSWQMQDFDYQRNLSQMQFGFSMIDADENVRYSRGRERRTAMRHRDEAVAVHSMEAGHLDTEESRAKERQKWADDLYQRERSHFDDNTRWERESMDLQKRHFDQNRQLEEKNFQLSEQEYHKTREFILQQRTLEDQLRTLKREIYKQESQEAIDSKKIHDNLALAIGAVNDAGVAATTTFNNLKSAFGFDTSTLSGFLNQISNLINGPSSRTSGGVTYTGSTNTTLDPGMTRTGFAEGGYTGDGSKWETAGNVHKGEYVIPQHGSPVVLSPRLAEALEKANQWNEKIYNKLDAMHRDGGNAVVNIHTGSPQQAARDGQSLFQRAWSS
jgi:hypothetical protein